MSNIQYFRGSEILKLVCAMALLVLLVGCGDHSFKPDVAKGEKVPESQNKILVAGGEREKVCSMNTADNLHRWRISDLRAAGRPFLVVFGTPQHCTMCVDQLVRVASLQEKYGDRFSFLHVDGYKDNAVWVEWGIKGEPWTFIVDGEGMVRKVFPGPTDIALMENEIDKIIQ